MRPASYSFLRWMKSRRRRQPRFMLVAYEQELRPSPKGTRTCAGTRQRRDPSGMVRLVTDPQGCLAVDVRGKAPGRGVWIQAERQAFLEALSAKRVARTFKGRIQTLPEGEGERLLANAVQQLEQSMLQLLGLARRSGELLVGMDAVSSAAGTSDFVLVMAEDVSPRSARKAEEAAHPEATTIRFSSMGKLGSMLGRTDVGVLGLRRSTLAERLKNDSERRAGLCGVRSSNEEIG